MPVTFSWDYDGEILTFELWGGDSLALRRRIYEDHTFVHVPDPRVVIVATEEIPAGEEIVYLMGAERIVQADESNADAFTDVMEVRGSVAAVTIPEGQPITPDLLVPAE